jgi:hypothetical protein
MSPALRRTFAPFDHHRSERKNKPNTLGRFHRVADGEMRIPQIALEDIVHRRDLPGLVLRVRATMATCRLGRVRSLSAAGVRRNSLCVSRTSTVRSDWISSYSSSLAINPRSATDAW